jgi:hypothetical protein
MSGTPNIHGPHIPFPHDCLQQVVYLSPDDCYRLWPVVVPGGLGVLISDRSLGNGALESLPIGNN